MPLIITPRTVIRPLLPEDGQGMFLLDSNPNVHRYIGGKPIKTIDESLAVIEFVRRQYEDNGIGRWAMLHKDTGDFIGWIGFKFMTERVNGHIHHYDFGYRLREEYWGQGYATEGSAACMDYGLNTLKLKDIYAMTDVTNMASRRVLEKTGFKLVEIFNYDAEPLWRKAQEPTTWYAYPSK